MIRSTLLASVAFSPFILTPAFAQQSFDLGTIALSSNLSPVELGRTGATVEVLEGAQAGSTDTSVIARLDRLPGVNSTSNGGLGNGAGIQIRGLSSRYVGVRVNGIDVTDPSSVQTQFNFGGLVASGIDRIEVLKGSQSALYGSEAIAGVINISTFTPEEMGFSGTAQAEGGSFDTYSGAFSAGYRAERGFVAFSYGRIETDGFSAQAFNDEDDGFEQTTIDVTAEYDATDILTFGAALRYRDGEVEIDRSAFDNDVTGDNLFTENGARVFARLQTGVVSHTFSYSYFEIEREDPTGFTREFAGERDTFAYQGSAELGVRTVLNFGADVTDESFALDGVGGSERNKSMNAELLFAASDEIDLSTALRYDNNSTFGGTTTGRVAAVWRPVNELTFRGVIGTGYRAPSLYERFSPFGDAALQPEDSLSFELGVEKTYGDVGFVKATLFQTEVENLIEFDGASTACSSGFGCYNQVPGTTTAKGVELSGEYKLREGLSVFGAYTYTDAKTEGARLTRTPRHDVVVGLSNDFTTALSGYIDVRYVGDVVPSSFAPVDNKVGDYTLVGMGLSYDVNDTAEVYMRVENLFDEDYETAGGFNQPGRGIYLGVRANF
jgi:vitamin B12 transporter